MVRNLFPCLHMGLYLYFPGDVVHAQVFGEHILILNSYKATMELLEKRASIYSDRPTIPMIPL